MQVHIGDRGAEKARGGAGAADKPDTSRTTNEPDTSRTTCLRCINASLHG